MRLPGRKLLWKGTLVLAVSSLVVLGVFTVFFSEFVSDRLMTGTRNYGNFLLEAVEQGYYQSMIHRDPQFIATLFTDLSTHDEIDLVAIYDRHGRLGISSSRGRGLSVDPQGELARLDRGTVTLKGNRDGHGTLVLARNIRNETRCHGCHSSSETILGSIGLELSLVTAERFTSVTRALLMAMVAGLVVLLMAVNLGFFTRFIVAPLDELGFKIREVEAGDTSVPFRDRPGDEIAELERSFGLMVDRVRRQHQAEVEKEREMALMGQDLKHQMEISAVNKQLAGRIRELDQANRKIKRLAGRLEEKNVNLGKMVKRISALNRLGVALSAEIEMDKLIRLVVNVAVKGLRAERGFMMLLNEDAGKLRMVYGVGLGEEYDRQLQVGMGESISGKVAQTGRPLLVEDVSRTGHFRRVSRYGFLRHSVICAPLRVKDRTLGTLELTNKKGDETFNSDDLDMLSSMCAQAAIAIDNAKLYQKIQKSYFDTIRALIQAVEEKDRYTRGHSERVTLFSLKIAEMMGLDQQHLETLKYAGYLHDIGKIGIDITILQKKGRLDVEEYNLVKNHPLIGDRIIAPIEFLKDVRGCVSQHHERYDGFGYPCGIRGSEMTLEARILAVADAYDAMITDRPYRRALTKEDALAELRRCSGSQFDPEVVEVFIEVLETDLEIQQLERSLFGVGT